jgi:hypothetical protein
VNKVVGMLADDNQGSSLIVGVDLNPNYNSDKGADTDIEIITGNPFEPPFCHRC